MPLQRRLTLFFILIVVLPLAAVGFFLQRVVVGEVQRRAELGLGPPLEASRVVYDTRAGLVDEEVRAAIAHPRLAQLLRRENEPGLRLFLRRLLAAAPGVDFLVALDRRGSVLASALGDAEFAPGVRPPSVEEITAASDGAGRGFTRTGEIPVRVHRQGTTGLVVGGFWVDAELISRATGEDVNLTVVHDGEVIAAAAGTEDVSRAGGPTRSTSLAGGMEVVATAPPAPVDAIARRVSLLIAALLAVVIVLTSLLAYTLARLITQPLNDLTEGVASITAGRFEHRIPVKTDDEVGTLASAFNDMTARLRDSIAALSSSRARLQRVIRRVGETMRATHDMQELLTSIASVVREATEANASVVWAMNQSRTQLFAARAVELDIHELPRLDVGEGVAGFAAERAVSVIVGEGDHPAPARNEPAFPHALAVPVFSRGRLFGVVCVYRDAGSHAFAPDDVEAVEFLAQQGGVAIENALLHEEAQRLSITDGLTGLWNRRYLQMQFRQVLATATRFGRPFSLLMLDLDHFKTVNDRYGHQQGDAVLVEFSKRVTRALREVDTLFRYGGEEFVALLTETDAQGALTTATKILEQVRGEPFGVPDDSRLRVTVSIGVAVFPEHGASLNELIDAADRALYRAKAEGRDRAVVASPPQPPELRVAT